MTERVTQLQNKVAKVRRADISPELASVLTSVGDELDVYFEVTSGGQNDETGRTGSHRHDDGNSADLKAYTLVDGKKHYLDQSSPDDQKVWSNILKLSVAGGAEGIGAGPDYMGNLTAHIGFGRPAAWGAGGKSANAPEWVTESFKAGQRTPPLNIPPPVTAAPVPMPSRPFGSTAPTPPPLPRPRPSAPTSSYTLPPPSLPLNPPIPSGSQSYWDSRNTVQPGMLGRGLPTPTAAASVQMAAPRPPSLPVPATNFAMLPNTGSVAAPTMADTRAEQALMRRPAPPLPAGALAGLNGMAGGVAGSIPAPAAPMPLPRPALPRPAVQSSPQVSALQQQLAASGYSPGKVDGIFGSKTDAAVRAFQQANGLAVDGIVGPKTMAALQKTQAPTPMPRPAPLPTVPVPSNGGNIFGNLLGGAMNTLGSLKDQAGNAITNVTQNVAPKVQSAIIQAVTSTPAGRGLVIDPIIASIGKSPTRVMPAPPPGKPAGYGSKGYSVNSAKAAMPWAF